MKNLEHIEPRHFALPAAFVLSLLAFFFFSGTRATPPTPPVAPTKPVHRPLPPDVIKVVEPPPIETDDPDLLDRPGSGGGGPPPPTGDEVIWTPKKGDFIVEVQPPRPHKGEVDVGIIPAYVGPGDGPGDRPGVPNNIIPARLLDRPPQTRSQTSPVYPIQEKNSGTTGSVEVEFVVDETGAVTSPWIVSSTHRAFEEPTLRAVAKWRFMPGRHAGKVVKFRMRVPVLFNLND